MAQFDKLPCNAAEWQFTTDPVKGYSTLCEVLEQLASRVEHRRLWLESYHDCQVTARVSYKEIVQDGRPAIQIDTVYRAVGENDGFYPEGSAEFQTFASIRGHAKA